MKFTALNVNGWRQFSEVEIKFHDRLTIISGSNGAGKSTLLRILSQHFGLNNDLIATPTINRSGVLRYLTGLFGRERNHASYGQNKIGSVSYSSGNHANLVVPGEASAVYSVQIPDAQQVSGLFIGSHRTTSGYQPIKAIPTNAIGAEQAYQAYSQEVINKYNNAYSQFSPIYRIKEAIISMATFGPGNRNVQANLAIEKHYEDFKQVLHKVLPPTVGFRDISIRIPDVVLVTESGDFVLDASSGGLMALIDIAWQMFLYSRDKSEFVAILDEPENHLHPSMQRVIIGNLLNAFPQAQLVVATHSPFVVSSVRDSAVYVLRHMEAKGLEKPIRTVFSERLDSFDKSGTASEILRSVLGVPVTLPLWAEAEIESISTDFEIESLTPQSIDELRRRLNKAGLGDHYGKALGRMAQKR